MRANPSAGRRLGNKQVSHWQNGEAEGCATDPHAYYCGTGIFPTATTRGIRQNLRCSARLSRLLRVRVSLHCVTARFEVEQLVLDRVR
jgi:hypothetical protein